MPRIILGVVLAVAALLGGYVTVGTANAQTGAGRETFVYFDLHRDGASENNQFRYSSFVASLREAVSVPVQNQNSELNGAQETQPGNPMGLVRARLSTLSDGRYFSVDLYIRPNDMYVIGYHVPGSNVRWLFNDEQWVHPLPPETQQQAPTSYTLPFGANYNALTQAAGRGREDMPISFAQVQNAIVTLAQTVENNGNMPAMFRQGAARSLMLLIQMTSEAARFNDIEGPFRSAMGTWNTNYLHQGQLNLETNWGTLSEYFHRIARGEWPAAIFIAGIGWVTGAGPSFGVRRYVRVLLGSKGTPDLSPYQRHYDQL